MTRKATTTSTSVATSPWRDAVVDRRAGEQRRRQRGGRADDQRERHRATRAAVGAQQHEQAAQVAPAARPCRAGGGAARRDGRRRAVGRSSAGLTGRHLALDAACASGRPGRAGPSRRSRGTARSARAARRGRRARRTRPWSSTTISSASEIVERRWAMTNVVRPAIASSSASLISARSRRRPTRSRRRGSARAGRPAARGRSRGAGAARRESVRPRSPTRVSKPSGSARDELVRLGAARGALDLLARSRRAARRRCSRRRVAENRNGSSVTTATARAASARSTSRTSAPSSSTAPALASYSREISATRLVLPEPVAPTSATRACPRDRRGRRRAARARARALVARA